MLAKIYKCIRRIKRNINQSKFFDFIILPNYIFVSPETKRRYIRRPSTQMITLYQERTYEVAVKNHLKEFVDFLDNDLQNVMNEILNTFRKNDAKEISTILESFNSSESLLDFFYITFKYCITNNYLNIIAQYPVKSDSFYLDEFYKKVIQPYGVSGKLGKKAILQMAEAGISNPYILFEAAELEFLGNADNNFNQNNQLDMAYEYYKKASDLGHALSDWSLGWLAQKSCEKSWKIKAYEKMELREKIETAIFYYKRAANKDCIKAYNSLGNLSANENWKQYFKEQLKPPKYYYQLAAEKDNVYGMINYAQLLEKELVEKIKENPGLQCDETIEKDATNMFKYFKKAANLHLGEACYRCALYYGHLTDERNFGMEQINFGGISQNLSSCISYLENAIQYEDTTNPLYNAYLFLSEIILTHRDIFFNYEKELKKADNYLAYLENNYEFNQNYAHGKSEKIQELRLLYEIRMKDQKKQNTKRSHS